MSMDKFWEQVCDCDHEDLYPDYDDDVSCGTPYCSGLETHCRKCGVFIVSCGCGFLSSFSGWPEKRWRIVRKAQERASCERV